MLMKVSELEGALLDAAVAKADGYEDIDVIDHVPLMDAAPPSWCRAGGHRFSPSSTWSHGGPIIERERIGPMWCGASWLWAASDDRILVVEGETMLQCAMRAYVASKFGDEIDLPC